MSNKFWTPAVLENSLRPAIGRFCHWYQNAFFSLFSPETLAWLTDRGDRRLVLKAGEGELHCVDGAGAPIWRLGADEIAATSLDEALEQRGLSRAAVRIVLDIDAHAFFIRRFDIPSVAANNLAKLLVADIERKTPFRLADVVYGHTSTRHPSAPDKISVSLWILRRDFIAGAIAPAGLDVADIAFVAPSGTDGSPDAPIIPLAARNEVTGRFRELATALCVATAVLAAVGVGVTLWRQSAYIDALDAKIQEMSARAASVRQVIDRASAESQLLSVLRNARRTTPLFADIWEETARVLPDGAFVTDLRLSESKANERALDIVGFADSAVGLPAIFNKSPLFTEAALTAPITPDPRERREGFSLQVKLEEKKPSAPR